MLEKLIANIKKYNPSCDEALIRRAFAYADEAHQGQKRNSGEPYIIHPLHVALILSELNMDDPTICAGLLHDTLEDTSVTEEEMVESFGEEITTLVNGVTKLKQIQSLSSVENQAENYRKMVVAMSNDIRVIIIKLADRLHNLRTLDYKTPEKQYEKSRETIEIYVPIAHRLGIYTIKSELEDLSLKYLDPNAYYEIVGLVNKKLSERKKYIEEIIHDLSEKLQSLHFDFKITGRPKTLYSIYKKMYQQQKNFDQIFDITAIRVILDSVKDCYSVLGVVHTMWKPIQHRFKDYIAVPKKNMYQSLHTTVIGPKGEIFEVQIRTWEMHKIAEYGIAAHWMYKEGKKKSSSLDEKLSWVRQLKEINSEAQDTKEFMQAFKEDFLTDEVYVFTPHGEVLELPKGSTPIDFAYRIHTDVGNSCVGAKVDGRLIPLETELSNGNIVEIITSKNSTGPSSDWLQIVKSSHARNKIRQFFKHTRREENILLGKDMIERDLRKDGYFSSKLMTEENLSMIASKMSFASIDDLYASVGYGSSSVASISSKLKDFYREEKKLENVSSEKTPQKESPNQNKVKGNSIRIKGEKVSNIQFRLSKCCHPVLGDPIIGFITQGKGISVHRQDCSNILYTKNKERLIELEWNNASESSFPSTFSVLAVDKSGYFAAIAEVISKLGLNLVKINASSNHDGTSRLSLVVTISNTSEIDELMSKIRKLNGTLDIYRISN